MIGLLKKFILLLVAFVVFDFIIGLGLGEIRDNSPDGRYFKSKYSLEDGKEDIVIFGASCAETDFASSIIEDSLNMTCWNAGRGGQGLPFWLCIELGILKRYTPKIAIVEIGAERLSADLGEFYEPAGILRPFYRKHKEIQPILDKISYFEKYFNLFNLYSYNSSYYYLFRPYFVKGLDGKLKDKGWKPLDYFMKTSKNCISTINTSLKLNKESLDMFNYFISNLTDKGCKVFVVLTPNYSEKIIKTSTLEYIKQMENVEILDFEFNDLISRDIKLYCDPMHLNRNGAIKYTSIFAHKFKEAIKSL